MLAYSARPPTHGCTGVEQPTDRFFGGCPERERNDPACHRRSAFVPYHGLMGSIPTAGKESRAMSRTITVEFDGQYRDGKIHQVDPQTGAILRTIESNRFVTSVTWVDGELWHATWEGDESDLKRVDPRSGEGLETLEMPRGMHVSGLESDGADLFFCGGGNSAKVRAVRRPRRDSAAASGSGIPVDSTTK